MTDCKDENGNQQSAFLSPIPKIRPRRTASVGQFCGRQIDVLRRNTALRILLEHLPQTCTDATNVRSVGR